MRQSEHLTYHTKCSVYVIYINDKVHIIQNVRFISFTYIWHKLNILYVIYINKAKWTFNISYKMFSLCYICKWYKVNISHIIQNVHSASFIYIWHKLNILYKITVCWSPVSFEVKRQEYSRFVHSIRLI